MHDPKMKGAVIVGLVVVTAAVFTFGQAAWNVAVVLVGITVFVAALLEGGPATRR